MVYGLKPEVWGRVVPDPQAELQVDPAQGPQAKGLGRPENSTVLKIEAEKKAV